MDILETIGKVAETVIKPETSIASNLWSSEMKPFTNMSKDATNAGPVAGLPDLLIAGLGELFGRHSDSNAKPQESAAKPQESAAQPHESTTKLQNSAASHLQGMWDTPATMEQKRLQSGSSNKELSSLMKEMREFLDKEKKEHGQENALNPQPLPPEPPPEQNFRNGNHFRSMREQMQNRGLDHYDFRHGQEVELNPQPLPPLPVDFEAIRKGEDKMLNPQPLPPGPPEELDSYKLQNAMEQREKSLSLVQMIAQKSQFGSSAINRMG